MSDASLFQPKLPETSILLKIKELPENVKSLQHAGGFG